ncbi:MAG: CSLREA domain-containing protein, partial [Nevskiales bacterium]
MAVAAAAGLGFASQPLMAATFTVNTFTDAGGTCPTTCTLRDAITKAELTDAADVIKFVTPTTAMGPQTITLTANLPLIERPLTITGVPGPKRRLITVDGADTFRMFRIDTLVPGMDVKISDLTMANGFAGANRGGCIYARHPDLILSNVSITSCGTNVNGGGIALRGFATLNMTDSLLSDNGAGGNGGGLYAQTFTAATPITIRNSSISHNGAGSNGGGLFLDVGSPVLIENTSLYYNNTGIMSHQQGGGIYILDTGGNGKITIRNSTLTENSAEHGGGIAGNVTGGRLEVDNSTLARNNAYYDGAGIHSNDTSGLLRIRNSTIAENNQYFGGSGTGGGGLYINDTDGVLLLNSIVQDNLSAASANPDLMGTAFVTENSIIGNTTGATIIGLAIDPATFLGGFADHGGPTATFATYTGTPIDNGDAAACSAINGNRDQRGVLRNVDA